MKKQDRNILAEKAANMTLLLVEDDELTRSSLQMRLMRYFKKIYSAASGDEALALYQRLFDTGETPDIILSDIVMSGKNGLEISAEIKSLRPDQKIILISAFHDLDNLVDAIRIGIDNFLFKPIRLSQLFEMLAKTVAKCHQERELEESRRLIQQTQEQMAELIRRQDKFIKDSIHELNTPLAIIMTNIELMRKEGITSSLLNPIEAACKTLKNTYEDMSYLLKRDRENHRSSKIDLVSFLRERIDYFRAIAQANRLTLHDDIGLDEAWIIIPDIKLQRLIDNNLSNAIKYSKRDTVITVSLQEEDESYILSFHNVGPVINDKDTIFQRFYRESEVKGGYGIGLAIVAEICKEEKIHYTLESSEEKGTIFSYVFQRIK
ncbi:MAG: hybrid sensor histidine kinase/response regulator [Campylobacterales bacterium]